MGGMSAMIPIKGDEVANAKAMDNVAADKLREAIMGHDGTWVAHPSLAPIAESIFNKHMPTANQIFRRSDSTSVSRDDLLNPRVPGSITLDGVKRNIDVCLIYMENWLRGIGCSQINFLMEDAATAEVSRSQLWQWAHHGASTAEGIRLGKRIMLALLEERTKKFLESAPKGNKFDVTSDYLKEQITGDSYTGFLTT